MAETPPDAPDTLSSYSDPLYDRLEGVVRSLGRKWWVIVLLALVSAAAAVVIHQRAQQVPEAASAAAFLDAVNEGLEELVVVAEDEAVLPEFRARAALEAANLSLAEGDAERAARLLETAEAQAALTPRKDLQLTILASQAAVLEEQGAWEDAAALYSQVADKTAAGQPGLNLVAILGSARTTRAQAEATTDPELKLELLGLAHEQFTFAADREVPGAETYNRYARLQRYDLERRHPQILSGEPLPAPAPEQDEAAQQGEDAPAEAEDAAAETEDPAAEAEATEPAAGGQAAE